MTAQIFEQLKNFLSQLPPNKHMYGHAVFCLEKEGVLIPLGSVHIKNSEGDEDTFKPYNYFISGENIEGIHYSLIKEVTIVCGKEHFILS